jgi:hypothetical protein
LNEATVEMTFPKVMAQNNSISSSHFTSKQSNTGSIKLFLDVFTRFFKHNYIKEYRRKISHYVHGSRWNQIPGVFNINMVESVSRNAKIERIPDGLKIRTPIEPWAYAAFFPMNKKMIGKSLTAIIEVQVTEGVFSVGFLSSDDKKIIDEKFITKSKSTQTTEIYTPDIENVRGIIIRNGALDNLISQGIICRLESK